MVTERGVRRVGVIGLGRMGLPMARRLVRAGFQVAGFDLDPQRGRALEEAGGSTRASLAVLAAESDAILVMVGDDEQVLDVTVGAEGVIGAAGAGTILVVSSTVMPATCTRIAGAAAVRGIGVLDAPVARGQRGAEAGTLTVFVGGPRDLLERCRPVFAAFSREVVHIDERVGSGQVAKLANNLLLWIGVVGAHEVLSLAERLGVWPRRVRQALLAGSADSYVLRELHLINLTWPHKDLAQAMEVAQEAGMALPLTERVRELIKEVTRDELRRLCGTTGEGGTGAR